MSWCILFVLVSVSAYLSVGLVLSIVFLCLEWRGRCFDKDSIKIGLALILLWAVLVVLWCETLGGDYSCDDEDDDMALDD